MMVTIGCMNLNCCMDLSAELNLMKNVAMYRTEITKAEWISLEMSLSKRKDCEGICSFVWFTHTVPCHKHTEGLYIKIGVVDISIGAFTSNQIRVMHAVKV